MKCENEKPPARRVVLLGASNLTRGISTVVETAQRVCGGGSLEVLSALGHGRSYGITSTVLGRTLPSILECGLWEALEARSDVPTAALVTDIGNDLMYQVEAPQIVAWVETVLERLQRAGARVSMTLLPVDSLLSVSPRRYYFFRSLMFPRCRLSFAEAGDRARQLHDRLQAVGQARRATGSAAGRVVRHRPDSHSPAALAARLARDSGFLAGRRRCAACAGGGFAASLGLSDQPLAATTLDIRDRAAAQTASGAAGRRHDRLIFLNVAIFSLRRGVAAVKIIS